MLARPWEHGNTQTTYLYSASMVPGLRGRTVSGRFHMQLGQVTIATGSHAVAVVARSAHASLDRGRAAALQLGHVEGCRLHGGGER
jgi:hypothetical protein